MKINILQETFLMWESSNLSYFFFPLQAYIFSIDAKELNILHEMKGKKVICL